MNTILFSILSGFVQSIPASASFVINVAVIAGVWLLLRKKKKEDFSIRIVNHTALFIAAWIAFSVITGLFYTFELLETSADEGLISGFLHGFRIALLMIPCGVLACCTLIIWFLSKRIN